MVCVWGRGDSAPAQADADSLCVLGQEEEGGCAGWSWCPGLHVTLRVQCWGLGTDWVAQHQAAHD